MSLTLHCLLVKISQEVSNNEKCQRSNGEIIDYMGTNKKVLMLAIHKIKKVVEKKPLTLN